MPGRVGLPSIDVHGEVSFIWNVLKLFLELGLGSSGSTLLCLVADRGRHHRTLIDCDLGSLLSRDVKGHWLSSPLQAAVVFCWIEEIKSDGVSCEGWSREWD